MHLHSVSKVTSRSSTKLAVTCELVPKHIVFLIIAWRIYHVCHMPGNFISCQWKAHENTQFNMAVSGPSIWLCGTLSPSEEMATGNAGQNFLICLVEPILQVILHLFMGVINIVGVIILFVWENSSAGLLVLLLYYTFRPPFSPTFKSVLFTGCYMPVM